MINAPFMSSAAATAPALHAIDRTQRRLADAQVELASGRHADLEVALGAGIRMSVALRQEKSQLSAITDANTVVKSRMDGSQAILSSVADSAQKLLATLLQSTGEQVPPGVVVETARQGLAAIRDALNTTMDGVHLFAGINSEAEPLTDYFGASGAAARGAVGAAFTTAFGTSQSGPGVSNISGASMQAFLDTAFPALFSAPSWNASWSAASDQVVKSRVSAHEIIETSATANEQPLRDIVRAFTMVADLGIGAMNPQARQTVLTNATKVLSEGLSGTTAMQSRLGAAATVLTDANGRAAASTHLIDHLLSDRETVDPADVSARVATLTRDLEAAYAIVARLNKLSLLDSL